MSQQLLSASSILEAVDLKSKVEKVPEWGGTVKLRQMTAEQQILFHKLTETRIDEGMFIIFLFSAVQEDNTPLFPVPFEGLLSDDPAVKEAANAELHKLVLTMKQKPFPLMNRLQMSCLLLNSMGKVSEEAIKNA